MRDRGAEKKEKVEGKQYGYSVLLLAFFLISFLGWAYETLLMLVWHGKFYDRGFLFLPFCPIYGFPVCSLYLLIGTPKTGRFSSWIKRKLFTLTKPLQAFLRYALYYLLAGAYATLLELIVGLILESAGLRLWSYRGQPLNFRGHICLQVSLLWGVMLTLFMRFVMPPVLKLLDKLPKKSRAILCILLSVLLLTDFGYSIFVRLD